MGTTTGSSGRNICKSSGQMRPFGHLPLATLSLCRLHLCSSEISHSMAGPFCSLAELWRLRTLEDSSALESIYLWMLFTCVHLMTTGCSLWVSPEPMHTENSSAVFCKLWSIGSREPRAKRPSDRTWSFSSVPVLSYGDCSQERNLWADEYSLAPSPPPSCSW